MTAAVMRLETVADLRLQMAAWRQQKKSVALAPTMGALHAGHLSLVELARQRADRVLVTIFVNPAQFGPNEDLDAYPRDLAGDIAKLETAGAHAAFTPNIDEIYPPHFSTTVSVGGVSEGLCGAHRPGHFDGVATVVSKLLLQSLPDVAIFGEKDYQQLLVIRRLVRDLDIPVEIIGAPIMREPDGLAMSSRNAYLSTGERRIAPILYKSLQQASSDLVGGGEIETVLRRPVAHLTGNGFQVEYLELRDAETLQPLDRLTEAPARLLVAARLGTTRLIDNIAVMR